MEVKTQLMRLEPDEHAADDVEKEISDELGARDADILRERVGNAAVQVGPDRPETDEDHFTSDDCLDTVPYERKHHSVENGEVSTVDSFDSR